MKYKQFSIFLISVLLISQSCTVEKRLHKRGYYVEWKSYPKFESKKIEKNTLSNAISEINSNHEEIKTSIDEIHVESNEENQDDFSTNDIIIEEKQNTDLETENIIYSKKIKKSKLHKRSENKSATFFKNPSTYLKEKNKDKNKNSKQNRLALIGFGMVLGSLLFFPLLISGFYVCAVALRQIKRKPNFYSNKYMGLIGYVLALVFITLIFLIFTSLILFVSSFSLPGILYMISAYLGIIVSGSVIINT